MSSVAVVVRGNPFPSETSVDRSATEWREPTVSHPRQWQQWVDECRDSARLRLWLFASQRETHLSEFWETRRLEVTHEAAAAAAAAGDDYHGAFEVQHQACVREVLRRQPDVAMIYLVSGSDVPLRSAAVLLRLPTDRTLWHASPQSLPHAMRRYLGAKRKLEFFGAMRRVEAYFERRHGSVSPLSTPPSSSSSSSSSFSTSAPASSPSSSSSSSSLSLLSASAPAGREQKVPPRRDPADADADEATKKQGARDGDERKIGAENEDDDDDGEIESWDDLVDVRMFEQSPWLHLTRKHAEAFVEIDFRAAFAPLDALTDDVHARLRDTFRSLQSKKTGSGVDEDGGGGGGARHAFASLDPEVYLEHYKDAKERGYGADTTPIDPNDARLQSFAKSQGLAAKATPSTVAAAAAAAVDDGGGGGDGDDEKQEVAVAMPTSADRVCDGGLVSSAVEKRPRHLQTFDELEFGGETRADIPAYKTVTALLMVGVPASEFCDWNANDCWYVDAQQREWDAIAWRRLAQPSSCVWMADAPSAAESDSDDDDDDDDGDHNRDDEEDGGTGEREEAEAEEKGKERKTDDTTDRILSVDGGAGGGGGGDAGGILPVGGSETGECVQYTFLQALAASQQDTETLFLRNVCASVRLDRLGLYTWHAIPMRVAKLWAERLPHELAPPSANDGDRNRHEKSGTRRKQEDDESGDQRTTLAGDERPGSNDADTCSPVRVGKQRLRDAPAAAKRSTPSLSEAEKRRTWERKRDDDDGDVATPESESGAAESAARAVPEKKSSDVTGVKRQRPIAADTADSDSPTAATVARIPAKKSAGTAVVVAPTTLKKTKKTVAPETLPSAAETSLTTAAPPPPPPVKKRKVAAKKSAPPPPPPPLPSSL